jgi:hypothetical protein
MRIFAGVLTAALVASACRDGDSSGRPEASARPDLTAEQIGAELDRVFLSDDEDGSSYRASITEQTFRPDGTHEETTSDEVVVGENSYTRKSDGLEALTYQGVTYVRTDPADEWRTAEDLGWDFSSLGTYFDNLEEAFTAATNPFQDADMTRLPDEFVNGQHALVVNYDMNEMLALFLEGLERTLEDLPQVTSDADDPVIPDRQTGSTVFWIDADTFEPLRLRMETVSYKDNQETERTVVESTYSDVNAVDELPVELPDAASKSLP